MVEHTQKPKVVITGISGFLGSQVTNYFLKDGGYSVRGTVRDKNNEKKVGPLKAAFGELFNQIELFNADLMDAESIDRAIQGCDYVVHTASPLPISQPKNEQELIRPAVDGTLAVVKAAHKYRVKRVVITSSCVAIMTQKPENTKELYDENDWGDLAAGTPYDKSKILAEQAAWDYVNSLPYNQRFELVVINPSAIFGPSLINGDFATGDIIKKVMTGQFPGVPNISFPIVDVRDVAYAHLQALKVPEARFHRFILSEKSYWLSETCQILHEHYPSFPIKTNDLGYCPVKFFSWFSDEAKFLLGMWGKFPVVDNTLSQKILGIKYIPAKEAIIEIAESLIKHGVIPVPNNK